MRRHGVLGVPRRNGYSPRCRALVYAFLVRARRDPRAREQGLPQAGAVERCVSRCHNHRAVKFPAEAAEN